MVFDEKVWPSKGRVSTFHACKMWDCNSKMDIREEDKAISLSSAKGNTTNHQASLARGVAILCADHVTTNTLDCGRFLGGGWLVPVEVSPVVNKQTEWPSSRLRDACKIEEKGGVYGRWMSPHWGLGGTLVDCPLAVFTGPWGGYAADKGLTNVADEA